MRKFPPIPILTHPRSNPKHSSFPKYQPTQRIPSMKTSPKTVLLKIQSPVIARLGRRAWRVAAGVGLRVSAAILALFALFGFNPQALAATDTWVGNTSASWNASNWSGTNNPPLTGDSLVFGAAGTSGLTLTDNLMTPSTFALGGITFSSGASAFVINPSGGTNGFTLNSASSIINHGANTETINDSIALTGTDTFTTDTTGGALTFGGVISNSTGVTGLLVNGGGTVTFNGSAVNTYTGGTTVSSGNLTLNFGNLGSTANLINSTSPLSLGGGTLQIVGNGSSASSQTFAGTTFISGASIVSAAGAGGNPTVALGTLTNTGQVGTVEFVGPATVNSAGSNVAATATITSSAGTGNFGLLTTSGGTAYGTVGLFDWATTDTTAAAAGTTIIGGSQVTGFYTALTGGVGASNLNYNVTSATAADSTGSTYSGDTLRFNTNIATTFTVTGFKNWGVGGILVTPTVGAHNVTFSDNGGTSDARGINNNAATNLSIVQNNTSGELIFSDSVFNHMFNGTGAYIQSGAGTVVMTGTTSNAETGASYLNGGVTEIAGDNELGGTTNSNVNLNGGTLMGSYTGSLDNGAVSSSHPVVLGSNGGGLAEVAGGTLTVDGTVSGGAGTGALVIGIPASAANGTTVGLVPGTGGSTANTAGVYANGTVVLSNASNSYTGGTLIESGTLQFAGSGGSASTAVFGTGAITLNGGAFQWKSGNTTDISGFSGGLAFGSNGGNLDTGGNSITLANPVGNNSAGGFTVIGGGSLTMNGANTFTGGVTVGLSGNNGNLTFGAANTYTGATAVTSGTLTLASGGSLGNTAVTVSSGGTLAAQLSNGGIGSGSAGVTLNNGSTLSLVDGAIGSLAVAGTLTLSGTDSLAFDFNATQADSMSVTGGALLGSGVGKIVLSDIGSAAPANGATFTLLTDSGGTPGFGSDTFTLGSPSITIGGQSYVLTLGNSTSTAEKVTFNFASLNYYWIGNGTGGAALGSWSDVTNFATDATGATPQGTGLSNTSNVFLTGSNVTAGTYSQTLDGTYTVNSLSFTGGGDGAASNGVTLATGTGGPLTIAALSTFIDQGGNSYAAGVGLVDQNGSAAHTISANVDLGQTQVWEIDSANALTVSGTVANASTAAGLIKAGSGMLILSASNSYTGGTTINDGTIQLGAAGALPTGGALTVTGTGSAAGTLDLDGNSQTAGVLSDGGVSAGTITSSAGTPSLTVTSGSFSGTISGGISLTENGASTLTLTGSNSYTGTTTVSNGTLVTSNNYALGNSASATNGLVMSGTSIADLKSSAPSIGALTGASGNDLVLGNAAGGGSTTTLTVNGGGAGAGTTFAGVISNASSTGYGNLTLTGGSLTLSGANTFSGTTLLTSGTLTLGNSLALQNSTVNIGGGTLSYGSQTSATFAALVGSGNLAAGTGTLTLGGNGLTNNYTGSLTGGSSLVTGGAGVQTFSNYNLGGSITAEGSSADALTISGGTFGGSGATLNIATTDTTAFEMTGGTATFGTVDLALGAGQSNGGMIITGGTATFTNVQIGAGGTNTASELLIDGAGSSVALGNVSVQRDEAAGPLDEGLVVESGSATANQVLIQPGSAHTADMFVTGGSLTIGTSSSSGAFEVGDLGTVNANLTVSGGALTYLGMDGLLMNVTAVPSTATLSGGITSLTGITLDDVNSATETSTLSVNDNATLYLGSVGLKEGSTPTVDSGASVTLGTATIGAIASWTSSVPLALLSGSTTTFQAANSVGTAENIGLSGLISGGGALAKTGAGTLTLTGTNTYSGGTTISAGTLIIDGEGALGGANYAGTTFNGGTLQYTTSFSGNGTGDITQNSAATPVAKPVTVASGGATIDTNGNAVTYANTFGNSGSGGLTVVDSVGTGSLTLAGNATYTGATTVANGGTLTVTGALVGTSAVGVNTGGTLNLNANNALNNSSINLTLGGGTLSVLASTSQTLGTLTLSGGGNSTLVLGDTASILNFADSSSVTWNGTLTIEDWVGSSSGGGPDEIFIGSSADLTQAQLNDFTFVNFTADGVAYNSYPAIQLPDGEIVASVPEPGTWASVLGGFGILVAWQRRRSRHPRMS